MFFKDNLLALLQSCRPGGFKTFFRMKKSAVFILAILCLAWLQAFAADVPPLSGRVNDYAGILNKDTETALSAQIKAHEERTTHQVVVLTVPSLEGMSIEEYAVNVFNHWELGQKGKDNGILIVVAPSERRMRIEVGYGLEGIMTDLIAGRIINAIMRPKFKNGDFNGGITAGANAVMQVIEGYPLPVELQGISFKKVWHYLTKIHTNLPFDVKVVICFFSIVFIGLFTAGAVCPPGMQWSAYFFLMPFYAILPLFVVGPHGALICLAIYGVGHPVAKLLLKNSERYNKWYTAFMADDGTSTGGYEITSGGSGSSWSSGRSHSSGSSDFSGGGGSSGGGGASGSW